MENENIALETELIGLERKYWMALQHGDTETVLNLADNPCMVAGPQGVRIFRHDQMEKMMTSQNYSLNRFELDDDIQVMILNDDAAVIAYRIREELTVNGESLSLEAADSSTWVRRDGKWVCSLHTESLTGDAFGRDRPQINSQIKKETRSSPSHKNKGLSQVETTPEGP